MRFASPEWLWLLPFVWIWCLPRGLFPGVVFSDVNGATGLGPRIAPQWWLRGLRALALTALVAALARPQSGTRTAEVKHSGVDIFLAVDTSGSMRALDLKWDGKPTPRLEVVKQVASRFVARRPSDRLGLVVFGEGAFVQCPLTLDHDLLSDLLKQTTFGMAGDATAVGDAIAIAVSHMKNLPAKSRTLVLLTDGASNAGSLDPDRAAGVAKSFGVKVYTVGVGVEGEAPFLFDTPLGQQVVYQRTEIDEPALKRVAEITGGHFFRAMDTEGLEKIYAEIDRLEKTEAKQTEFDLYEERFAPLALLGLMTLVLELVLGETVWRRLA